MDQKDFDCWLFIAYGIIFIILPISLSAAGAAKMS